MKTKEQTTIEEITAAIQPIFEDGKIRILHFDCGATYKISYDTKFDVLRCHTTATQQTKRIEIASSDSALRMAEEIKNSDH